MKKVSYLLLAFGLVLALCACKQETKHEHSFSDNLVASTCTSDGYTEHKCECGESYKDNIVKAKGHNFSAWSVVEEPTYEKDGKKERTCECGEKESESIPMLVHAHSYSSTVVEPTCKENGYTLHTCGCGDSYQDTIVEKLPHEFGEWEVVSEPTYKEEGLKERTCKCGEKEQLSIEKLEDTEAPVIEFASEIYRLNTFKTFNPLDGVTATDEADGNVIDKVEVEGTVDNTTRGTYTVVYKVKDEAGNETTKERKVQVVWDYQTSFIGHGGCYYGVMNSEEAILYAATVLKYQLIEVDVKVTKDGVFVLSHDDTWGGVTIASTNYNDLKTVVQTTTKSASYPMAEVGQSSITYSATICTLERYLEICKTYGVKPVIELKGGTGINNSSQSNMGRLMKTIEEAGLINECILLGSAYNCLIWTRNNGYENVKCQYLVDSCANQTYLDRCIQYNLDISMCVTYGNGQTQNTPEWIAKYQAEGLEVSTYTFTQYSSLSDVQKWINQGVEYVTVDWQPMNKLNNIENSAVNKHTVSFLDKDGNLIKDVAVKDGKTAGAPKAPVIEGYEFIGWDKEITNVTSDMIVTAQYEIINYSIVYNENLDVVTEKTFESKDAFVEAFYNDFYDWLVAYAPNSEYITVSNKTVTVTRNSTSNGKAIFSSGADIKALNVYVLESALSSFIYKPIEGSNSDSYVPEVDNNYFLNSEPYRTKYINMNKYLLNVLNTAYTGYSKVYAQASNNRVQIFFRFHQWCNGTNIPSFNSYPSYYEVEVSDVKVTLPEVVEYTIEDEIILGAPVAEGMVFEGWYLDSECTQKIEKIEKGTTGKINLYAKWQD